MSGLISECGYVGPARRIFRAKLAAIYDMVEEIGKKKAQTNE